MSVTITFFLSEGNGENMHKTTSPDTIGYLI